MEETEKAREETEAIEDTTPEDVMEEASEEATDETPEDVTEDISEETSGELPTYLVEMHKRLLALAEHLDCSLDARLRASEFIYQDPKKQLKAFEKLKQGLASFGMACPDVPPLQICGDVSQVLCRVALENEKPKVVLNKAKKIFAIIEPEALQEKLENSGEEDLHLIKVDTDSHSYVLLAYGKPSHALLLQANNAAALPVYELSDWLNASKSEAGVPIVEHLEWLSKQSGTTVDSSSEVAQEVVALYSHSDVDSLSAPFKFTNLKLSYALVNKEYLNKNIEFLMNLPVLEQDQ